MKYVIGFAFTNERVLLIKKNRPDYQKNKYNGVGGKLEKHELPIDAMIREFREEVGIKTSPDDWQCFCKLVVNESTLFIFKTFKKLPMIHQMEDEIPGWQLVSSLPDNLVDDVPWLITMALNGSNNACYDIFKGFFI